MCEVKYDVYRTFNALIFFVVFTRFFSIREVLDEASDFPQILTDLEQNWEFHAEQAEEACVEQGAIRHEEEVKTVETVDDDAKCEKTSKSSGHFGKKIDRKQVYFEQNRRESEHQKISFIFVLLFFQKVPRVLNDFFHNVLCCVSIE